MRFVAHRKHQGPGPTDPAQGTRTGTVDMGTLNGPKQAPPVTQFGGKGVMPNTQTVVNEHGAWPENRGLPELPGGIASSRDAINHTEAELHLGPPPGRILRQLFVRVFGYTSVNADPVGDYGFPYNGDWAHIPHMDIPRAPYGPSPMVRAWDNNAPISAVYAGNPRGTQ
jgi:hypothetical protein